MTKHGPLGLYDGIEPTKPLAPEECRAIRRTHVIVKQWEFLYNGRLFMGGRDEYGYVRAKRLSESDLESRWLDWCAPDFKEDDRLIEAEKAEAAYADTDWHHFYHIRRGIPDPLMMMAILPTTPFGKYYIPCGCKDHSATGCVNAEKQSP